jgi:hypothetical protein
MEYWKDGIVGSKNGKDPVLFFSSLKASIPIFQHSNFPTAELSEAN